MTERIGNIVVISDESPQKCQKCGRAEETRPYGFNGMEICHNCYVNGSPELKAEVKRRFNAILDG